MEILVHFKMLVFTFLCIYFNHCTAYEADETLRSTKLKAEIKYLLFDRENFLENGDNKTCWLVMPRDGNVLENVWKPDASVKIIVHGFHYKSKDTAFVNSFMIGQEYGKINDSLNIIVVDWTSLAIAPLLEYPTVARSTRYAGRDIAELIVKLKDKGHLELEKVHLIGYSLGAHTAGVAGYEVQKQLSGTKVGRITGLDPAGPEFDMSGGFMPKDVTGFLESSDADFVDILHCNMGKPNSWKDAPLYGKFGSWVQAGHVDFYPNGGEKQKHKCSEFNDRMHTCSHLQCPLYYALSIKVREYLACPCISWEKYEKRECVCNQRSGGVLMGDRCPTSARGRYYLSTIHK